jgi:hypothetical protein
MGHVKDAKVATVVTVPQPGEAAGEGLAEREWALEGEALGAAEKVEVGEGTHTG